MATQAHTNQTPTRGRSWRLAGLTLVVLALHTGGWVWWQGNAGRRPDTVVALPPQAPPPQADAALSVGAVRVNPPTPPQQVAVATAALPATKKQQKTPPALINKGIKAPYFEDSPPPPQPISGGERALSTTPLLTSAHGPDGEKAPLPPPPPSLTVAGHLAPSVAADDLAPGVDSPEAPDAPELLQVAAQGARARSLPLRSPVEQATVARHLTVPPSTTLAFRVRASRKGLTLPADSTLTWQTQGNTYSASMVFEAMFGRSRSQTSVGSLDPVLGLQPRRFGDKNRTEVATHFDRSRNPPAVRFSNNAPDVPLTPSTQDRLSVLIQLAAMVAGEPKRYPPGQTVVLHTVSSRDADLWRFVVQNTEELDLPVGSLETVHLAREALNAYDNRVEVWLAPSLGHLPVRILWTQANGDVVDQQLRDHHP